MTKFVIRRTLQMLPLLLVISFLSFMMFRIIPNTPFRLELANNPDATEEDIRRLEQRYGLDQPLPIQYWNWLTATLRGDWGRSFITRRPVFDMIWERLPATLTLAIPAFVFSLLIGVSLGIYSALKRNTWTDFVLRGLTTFFTAMPSWFIGLVAIIILGGQLRLFPQGGMFTVGQQDNLLNRLWHLILPVSILSIDGSIGYLRLMRSQTLDILRADFVRTARAKGLTEQMIMVRHILRNAILPIWTGLGGLLAALVSGAAIFEGIFSWPGVGRLVLESIFRLDYPVVLAFVMLGSTLLVIGNLL
ncbi:MAG: ABC transporter permease, partial [Dehalococcoidia bacterium]|nr:ABC transporter permease [Dehalococcoidia bacterium]